MAQVPSNRFTFLDVMSSARELAKTVDQKRILVEQGKYFYKVALSEIVTLLNSSADPSYFKSSVLTIAADQELLKDSAVSAGIISAIDAVNATITRTSGSFAAGDNLHIAIISSAAVITSQGIAKVTNGGATATYSLISGSLTTLGGTDRCSVLVVKSYSTTTSSISSLNYDRIIAIQDSNKGTCIELSPRDFFSVSRSGFETKSYDDDIVWTQFGSTLYFRKGAKVSAIGTLTMYWQRQPDYPVSYDDSDKVDLADKWVPLLLKKIYTLMILQVENDIPKNLAQEMQLDYQQIIGTATAELANQFKRGTQTQDLRGAMIRQQ